MVTQERLKAVVKYDYKTGIFTWKTHKYSHRVGCVAGCVNGEGYVVLRVGDKLYLAHRLAFLYMTGEWPKKFIDHINADNVPEAENRVDNRWCNLREATNRTNLSNCKRHREGHAVGTHFLKRTGKYQSTIEIGGKGYT